MAIKTRSYNNISGYSEDFLKVCEFLIRINQKQIITPNYLWSRWVWQFGPYMSMKNLAKIAIVEDNEKIVGLANYENDIGEAYFCVDSEDEYVKPQLINYAVQSLSLNGELKITLPDGDLWYQQSAVKRGFIPTMEKSSTARIDINDNSYVLPNDYYIMSFDDERFDVDRYYAAIWMGFDNKRERNEKEMESMKNR